MGLLVVKKWSEQGLRMAMHPTKTYYIDTYTHTEMQMHVRMHMHANIRMKICTDIQ